MLSFYPSLTLILASEFVSHLVTYPKWWWVLWSNRRVVQEKKGAPTTPFTQRKPITDLLNPGLNKFILTVLSLKTIF